MSSLLNVSNSSSKSEGFSLKDIEVPVDSEEQNWSFRAYVGKFLGIAHIIKSTTKLAEEDIMSRAFLQAEGEIRSMKPPRKDAQIMIFPSASIVNSRIDKGKALKEHIPK